MGLVKRTFAVNLTIMRIFGLYPPRRYKALYKVYAYFLYCILTVPVPSLATLYLYLKEDVDLAQISDNAFVICQAGCFIFKLLPFINNGDAIRRSLYMLECPIFNMYTNKQEEIIQGCIRVCKRNSYFFLVFCLATFSSWTIVPFLGSEYRFPIDVWLPYNATAGPKSYYFSYLFIGAGVGSGAVSSGMVDPLIAGLAYCATSQLKILKDNLQYLSEYTVEEISNIADTSEKERIIYSKIKFCIDHHVTILNFVENYENTYSSVVFTQFVASVLVICISCLQLSMVEPFTFTFFAMIIFIVTVLMEIFLYCYYGATLFEESNTLANAVYMGKWYEFDVKSRRALIILMERTKRPMIVTAGKILDLSLETFTTILRRSYSLLAVLRNY